MPAAKLGDQVVGVDIHIILVPTPGGPVPTPLPHPFAGKIMGGCSSSVLIEGKPAATVSSTANAVPPHIPSSPASFQAPPTNQATIMMGSPNVLIGNGGGGGGGGGAGSDSGKMAEAPDLSKEAASAARPSRPDRARKKRKHPPLSSRSSMTKVTPWPTWPIR